MPAWRILVCLVLVIGFSLSVKAESTGTATIRIVVSHVPTVSVARNLGVDATASGDNLCVSASVHANPHRIQPVAGNAIASSTHRIQAGGETCLDASATSPIQAAYRIVPE